MKINVINVRNWDIWHAIVLRLDVLTVIIMAMLWQIVQTKSHHLAHQQGTGKRLQIQDTIIDHFLGVITRIDTIIMIDLPRVAIAIVTLMIIGTGVGITGQYSIPTATDTGETVAMTQGEAILGLPTVPDTAVHGMEVPAHITTDKTPCTVDPHPIEVSPETAVHQGQVHHTNTTTEHQQDLLTALDRWTGKLRIENTNRSPLMIHHLSTIGLMSKQLRR